MNVGWTDIKAAPPSFKEITVRVVVVELKNRTRQLQVWWWSPQKADWIQAVKDLPFNANVQGPWRVAAWVRAWRDQDILHYVDNVKILDQSRR